MLSRLILAFVLYLSLVLICDLLEYRGIEIWTQSVRTSQCYDWFEHYLPQSQTGDLSEGLFLGNYSMSLREATIRKYDYIYQKLGLEPGMRLFDAGTGNGKFIEYCQSRGVHAVGVTLSQEQVNNARGRGLDARVEDYRILNASYLGQFDRVTILGSSEHICLSLGYLADPQGTRKRCLEMRRNVFRVLSSYLKPGGSIYVTILVNNDDSVWTWKDWMNSYILERHYGGFYSSLGDVLESTQGLDLQVTDLQDHTVDYHWSSTDPTHFGHWTINWREDTRGKMSYILWGMLTDCHFIHHWLYYFFDVWLGQFGGYQNYPLTKAQVVASPVHLKYFMVEANKKIG